MSGDVSVDREVAERAFERAMRFDEFVHRLADAGRIQPRQGEAKGQATHFYYVPEGCLQSGQVEEGTAVDETVVQPQSRNAPAPTKKKAKKAKAAGAPAQ